MLLFMGNAGNLLHMHFQDREVISLCVQRTGHMLESSMHLSSCNRVSDDI